MMPEGFTLNVTAELRRLHSCFPVTDPKPRIPILAFAHSYLGIRPYDWQAKIPETYATGNHTAVAAANFTGKTSTVFPAAALWTLYCHNTARVMYLRRRHETECIPLTEYIPIFRVPEYSELSIRVGFRDREGSFTYFFGTGSTVGWSERNFARMAAVCGLGDRRPSSQLRKDAKVRWK